MQDEEKRYRILSKDINLSVESLSTKFDITHMPRIRDIDETSLEISKLTMGVLVRKGMRLGYPKPDDQEGYCINYVKENFPKT